MYNVIVIPYSVPVLNTIFFLRHKIVNVMVKWGFLLLKLNALDKFYYSMGCVATVCRIIGLELLFQQIKVSSYIGICCALMVHSQYIFTNKFYLFAASEVVQWSYLYTCCVYCVRHKLYND